jgi:hypothetical protein
MNFYKSNNNYWENEIRVYLRVIYYVEESIVNAPPDYHSDQLFKSNLTFCVFLICSLKNQSFLRRVVHSQSTLQRQLRRQI